MIDAIDKAASLSPKDALSNARRFRPEFVQGAELCRLSVPLPANDQGFATALRVALACRSIAALNVEYSAELVEREPTEQLQTLAKGAVDLDKPLATIARHVDLITLTPNKAVAGDITRLAEVGMFSSVRLKSLNWHPHMAPVELSEATPEQLDAMKVTPSAKKVSEYVRTLVHDPQSYVARTVLFNAIMSVEGGLARPDRELGALGASIVNGCKFCAVVHARRHAELTKSEMLSPHSITTNPKRSGHATRQSTALRAACLQHLQRQRRRTLPRCAQSAWMHRPDAGHRDLRLGAPADACSWPCRERKMTLHTGQRT